MRKIMMTGMLQVHCDALKNSNTIYHEFLLVFKDKRKEVYGFVEGKEDPMYYVGAIESRIPEEWAVRLIRAGNKERVFQTLSAFDWDRFQRNRVCFFADRDLSDFIDNDMCEESNVYLTDGYSLENQIVTAGTFLRVLREVYGVSELKPNEEAKLCELFEHNLKEFQKALSPLMAQIIIWRREGSKACLNNIKLKEIFEFKDGSIKVKENYLNTMNLLEYAAKVVNESVSESELIKSTEDEFRRKDGDKKYIRGKYLLWFFIECAKNIHITISRYCSKHTKPPKVRVPMGQNNAMIVVAPRSRVPGSLAGFIESNYQMFIQQFTNASRVSAGAASI